jgi:hypothetical protein
MLQIINWIVEETEDLTKAKSPQEVADYMQPIVGNSIQETAYVFMLEWSR